MVETAPARPAFDVVALTASAGGLEPVLALLAPLTPAFPAAILLVKHLDPKHRSLLPEILGRRTSLRVRPARDGDRPEPGTVLVAPPGRHLVVAADGRLELTLGGLVHFLRPAADLLFTSVAEHYRERAIAVVLSGSGEDGAAGIRAIKARGGTTIAQARDGCEYFGMPGAAIQTGAVDFVLPVEQIAARLLELVGSKGDGP